MQKSSNIPWLDNFWMVFSMLFFRKNFSKSFTCLQGTFGCAAGHLRILKGRGENKALAPWPWCWRMMFIFMRRDFWKKKHTNTGWWFGTWIFMTFHVNWECHHPNWLIFFRFTNHQPEHDEFSCVFHIPKTEECHWISPINGCHLNGPLLQDFWGNLATILAEVPCDWEVISLKSRCPYGRCVSKHLSKVMVDGNGAPCSGLNFGFFAMLYKVKKWWGGEELGWFRATQCMYSWYILYI